MSVQLWRFALRSTTTIIKSISQTFYVVKAYFIKWYQIVEECNTAVCSPLHSYNFIKTFESFLATTLICFELSLASSSIGGATAKYQMESSK